MTRRTPKELTKYLKSKNILLRSFTDDEKKQFTTIQKQIRFDTNNKLTETEYEQLTVMLMFLHKYDKWAKNKKPNEIATDIQNIARMYRERIIAEMRKYREKGGKGESFLSIAKEIILEMEKKDGGEMKFHYKKPKIIKINVPTQTDEE